MRFSPLTGKEQDLFDIPPNLLSLLILLLPILFATKMQNKCIRASIRLELIHQKHWILN